ncbi:MAG: hypothetical protein QOI21_1275 [Actinomycetota bacterium]|nr:hypothetical protein [Actinomycetota bacterium]
MAGPTPAKPAPLLPADSIAYDTLPVQTARPDPFTGDCSQLLTNQELAAKLGMTGQPSADTQTCMLKTSDGYVYLRSTPPSKDDPDPWGYAWRAITTFNQHFRRILLDGRYYATTAAYLGGCALSVNTGSKSMFSVTYRPPEGSGTAVGSDSDYKGMSDKYCPVVKKLALDFLDTVAPGGGSLALPD